jgi:hypothetical protein
MQAGERTPDGLVSGSISGTPKNPGRDLVNVTFFGFMAIPEQ